MTTPYSEIPKAPLASDPANPIAEAENAAYDALCTCDDTYGDNPFCAVCEYEEQLP